MLSLIVLLSYIFYVLGQAFCAFFWIFWVEVDSFLPSLKKKIMVLSCFSLLGALEVLVQISLQWTIFSFFTQKGLA